MANAPTKLPTQTIAQLPSSRTVVTLRLAQAITIRLLPVNSSAPATTTSIRPSENVNARQETKHAVGHIGPSSRDRRREDRPERDERPGEHGEHEHVEGAHPAFATPTVSALRATSPGGSASRPPAGNGDGV